jgi:DMSO/TMAO reductase YedYZ molybdopterin-dependent catalytic subunit
LRRSGELPIVDGDGLLAMQSRWQLVSCCWLTPGMERGNGIANDDERLACKFNPNRRQVRASATAREGPTGEGLTSMNDRSLLPPGQQLVAAGKWPVIGERLPRDDDSPWRVTIAGLVERPLTLALDELRGLPQRQQQVDIHCVTRWSKLGAPFGGVLLADLLKLAHLKPDARFVSFVARSARSHRTSLQLSEALKLNTLVAIDYDDAPLAAEHGGPVRVVTPGRYFYKSLKWLERVELLQADQLGYWEREAGYHNWADPWLEQRYIANQIDRRQLERILQNRDFSGLDLLGLDVSDRELTSLKAHDALLRNANFSRCRLSGACFDRANLSNAHFAAANLQNASFRDADVEGADFSGADLRGADFRGASLVGVTFFASSPADTSACARFDAATCMDGAALEQLTPLQAEVVQRGLMTRSSQ